MSTTVQSRNPAESVVYINFNQDLRLLLVGTKTGYIIYSLSSLDTLEEVYRNETEEICLVQTLFSADRLVLVSASNPCRLSLFQFKQEKELFSYSYLHKVVGVQLNRLRLIVCLEQSIEMYDVHDLRHLHTIHDTPVNRQGVCALCLDNDHSYLAYPGSLFAGEINIFDTVNLKAVTVIRAHDSPIAAVTFDSSGSLIATASEKGTVIRVFTVKDGQKLYDFRRGVKRFASIYSLRFSLDSAYLSCSSNTESVHVFKLDSQGKARSAEDSGWMDYFGQAIRTSASYLPTQVTEMLSQGRDFAIARLPSAGLKSVCAIVSVQGMPRLLVATQEGYLYVYSVEPADGGQCNLLRQHRIDSGDGRKILELLEPVLPSVADETTERVSCGLKSCFPFNRSSNTDHSGGAATAGSGVPASRQSYASVVMKRRGGPQDWQPDSGSHSLEKSPSWQDEVIMDETRSDERKSYHLSNSEFPAISLKPK